MMQKGACYIRVSTEEQTEFSPEAQFNAIQTYADKNDIHIDESYIYADEGISGKRAEKRPAFMRMIRDAKLKSFDVILVHKFDRFARSREDSVVYKSLLRKEAGIKVVSVTETIEDDKFSVIMEAMLEAMAEYYSLNLADEVKKGMTEKALRGGYQTHAPFGYRMDKKKLIAVPQEADFVRIVFEKYCSGEMSMRSLAGYANDLGIKTKRHNRFDTRNIKYILNNPVYIGEARWTPTGKARRNFNHPDSIVRKSDHEAIIDLDIWNKVQQILKNETVIRPLSQGRSKQLHTWLSGLTKCGSCGKALVVQGQSYLQCSGYAKGSCKTSHFVKIKAIEDLVIQELSSTFTGCQKLSFSKSKTKENPIEIDFLQKKLQKTEEKADRIQEAYLNGVDSLEEYKNQKKLVEKERNAIQCKLQEMSSVLFKNDENNKRFDGDVLALFVTPEVSINIKHKAAHFLIKEIIYDKEEQIAILYYR